MNCHPGMEDVLCCGSAMEDVVLYCCDSGRGCVCICCDSRVEDACYVVTVGWRMCVVLCYCEWSGECVFVSVLTVWSICCHCEWWMCEYVSIV